MAEFNKTEFIVTNIINGIKKGTFEKEYGNIMAVKFVAKGFITFDDVATIDAEITAWEEQKLAEEEAMKEPVVEEPNEETTDESTEIETETTTEGEEVVESVVNPTE